MTKKRNDRLKPWKPGQSGNPAGRPAGTKNKATIFKEIVKSQFEEQITEHLPAIIEAVARKAAEGDVAAAKLVFDKIIPNAKAVDLEKNGIKGTGINIIINAAEPPTMEATIIEGETYEAGSEASED